MGDPGVSILNYTNNDTALMTILARAGKERARGVLEASVVSRFFPMCLLPQECALISTSQASRGTSVSYNLHRLQPMNGF